MKLISLPNQPTDLALTTEVRDYDLGDGKFCRVIMELSGSASPDHYELKAQCFEMNKDGGFVAAPNGYPSRSHTSTHTILKSELNKSLFMDDAWCVAAVQFDPINPGDTVIGVGLPLEPGTRYGQLAYDESIQRVYMWKEGYADSTARAKVEDLRQVLASSAQLSGLGFRSAKA